VDLVEHMVEVVVEVLMVDSLAAQAELVPFVSFGD
jgi:hypothetical protein